MELCHNCLHDEHKPGQCWNCNCGESEICHGTFADCFEYAEGAWFTKKREVGGLDAREVVLAMAA